MRIHLIIIPLALLTAFPHVATRAAENDSRIEHTFLGEMSPANTFISYDGAVLIGTQRGPVRLDGEKLSQVAPYTRTGEVFALCGHDGMLVGARKGLFRLHKGDLHRVGSRRNTGRIFCIETYDGGVLVGAEKGLFLLQGKKLKRLAGESDVGDVLSVLSVEGHDAALVGTLKNGLFRLDMAGLQRLASQERTGEVAGLYNGCSAILVGTSTGLYRLDNQNLQRIPRQKINMFVYAVACQEPVTFVASLNGLFLLRQGRLKKINADDELGPSGVSDLCLYKDQVILADASGIYEFDGKEIIRLISYDVTGSAHKLYRRGDRILASTDHGLLEIHH